MNLLKTRQESEDSSSAMTAKALVNMSDKNGGVIGGAISGVTPSITRKTLAAE
jgi:hypothetical protein